MQEVSSTDKSPNKKQKNTLQLGNKLQNNYELKRLSSKLDINPFLLHAFY